MSRAKARCPVKQVDGEHDFCRLCDGTGVITVDVITEDSPFVEGEWRMALRSVEEWDDEERMDDVVVRDVPMMHMEQMSKGNWWLACYLDDGPDMDRITFNIYWDSKLRDIVIKIGEWPRPGHTYEDGKW